jgi:UDP-N-acetylglucosamine 2-epimerase (non-hydrolysing)
MSQVFFKDLEIPKPDIYLGVGSGGHGEQTGKVLIEFEKVLIKYQPDIIIVVGDVNTTLAGALAGAKLLIPVAHIEAGLRSFDRTMPEEINRILTDQISDYLFIHSPEARDNLIGEGVDRKKIYHVGNVMIDTLLAHKDKAVSKDIVEKLGVNPQKYALLTLHRPSNVDNLKTFTGIVKALDEIQKYLPIVFPIHPRTKPQLEKKEIRRKIKKMKNIIFTEPKGYLFI